MRAPSAPNRALPSSSSHSAPPVHADRAAPGLGGRAHVGVPARSASSKQRRVPAPSPGRAAPARAPRSSGRERVAEALRQRQSEPLAARPRAFARCVGELEAAARSARASSASGSSPARATEVGVLGRRQTVSLGVGGSATEPFARRRGRRRVAPGRAGTPWALNHWSAVVRPDLRGRRRDMRSASLSNVAYAGASARPAQSRAVSASVAAAAALDARRLRTRPRPPPPPSSSTRARAFGARAGRAECDLGRGPDHRI